MAILSESAMRSFISLLEWVQADNAKAVTKMQKTCFMG